MGWIRVGVQKVSLLVGSAHFTVHREYGLALHRSSPGRSTGLSLHHHCSSSLPEAKNPASYLFVSFPAFFSAVKGSKRYTIPSPASHPVPFLSVGRYEVLFEFPRPQHFYSGLPAPPGVCVHCLAALQRDSFWIWVFDEKVQKLGCMKEQLMLSIQALLPANHSQ